MLQLGGAARRGAPLRFYFCARFRRFHRLRYNTTCTCGYIYVCTYAPCRNAQLPYYIILFTSAVLFWTHCNFKSSINFRLNKETCYKSTVFNCLLCYIVLLYCIEVIQCSASIHCLILSTLEKHCTITINKLYFWN